MEIKEYKRKEIGRNREIEWIWRRKQVRKQKRVGDVGYSGRQRRTEPIARVAVARNTVYLQHGAWPEVRGPSFVMSKGCAAHMLGNQGSAFRGSLQWTRGTATSALGHKHKLPVATWPLVLVTNADMPYGSSIGTLAILHQLLWVFDVECAGETIFRRR
jgi:hypothetical protein